MQETMKDSFSHMLTLRQFAAQWQPAGNSVVFLFLLANCVFRKEIRHQKL
jgi:hypothetical protein